MEEELANLNLIDEEEDAFHEEATVFLEYDSSILIMGIKKFMRIGVRLDVIIPLKRKNKIQIGNDQTIYACFQYEKLREEKDTGRNNKGDIEKSYLNLNFIILGSGQKILTKGIDNWRNMDSRELNGADSDNRPMDLVLTEKNDPLLPIEYKK
ncbi:hypothetical protein Godav_025096 [Gossypium davidsonii]|uniref:Uncharacterized protein n=2 Tax=Gossypium TaxID=3633 RepID=A0A7J8TKM3_GOSDV|nr:hypothetical protein [Gossypium davidsonii]MBA0671623.1 hypothetical protein [Gossypium klotzschianum]